MRNVPKAVSQTLQSQAPEHPTAQSSPPPHFSLQDPLRQKQSAKASITEFFSLPVVCFHELRDRKSPGSSLFIWSQDKAALR